MRIVIEFVTNNYLVMHKVAISLKKEYPGAKFLGILGFRPGVSEAYKFLTKQVDIKYESFITHRDFSKNTNNIVGPDWNVLRAFEELSEEKSIWRLVTADRNLGSRFIHGANFIENVLYNDGSDHIKILTNVSIILKNVTKIFDDFRPDIIIPSAAICSLSSIATEQLAKFRGVTFFYPFTVRVNNIFSFSDNHRMTFPVIEKLYLKKYEENREHENGLDLYSDIVVNAEKTKYFDRQWDWVNPKIEKTSFQRTKLIFSLVKSFLAVTYIWLKSSKVRKGDNPRRQPNTLRAYLSSLWYALCAKINKFRLLNPDYYSPIEKGQKYIYCPLHITPEYSTQVMGKMWLDQVALIEAIAKSIPADWIVYVKEHPATLVFRSRPYKFYDELKKIPNLRLAPVNSDMNQIISNAQMTAVITGTAGWESILRGIPVINFAECFFDCLNLSTRCSSFEDLSLKIYSELERHKSTTKEERRRRLISFFSSIAEEGFEVSYPHELNRDKVGTVEQYNTLGEELSSAIIKYVRKNHKKKEQIDESAANQVI